MIRKDFNCIILVLFFGGIAQLLLLMIICLEPVVNPSTKSSMDMEGTLKNISELRDILIKGSYRQELPIKGISKHPEKTYKIPRTIHLIWIGSELPQRYIRNVLLMHGMNTEFNFYLWLDDSSFTNTTLISFMNRKRLSTKNVKSIPFIVPELVYDAKTLGMTGILTDIIRFEIIFSHGGIYIDIDTIALKPFPTDIFSHSFVAYTIGYDNLTSSFFGLPKGSLFLKFILDFVRMKTYRKYAPDVLSTAGPPIFTTGFVDYNDSNIYCIHQKFVVGPRVTESYSYQTLDHNWMKKETSN